MVLDKDQQDQQHLDYGEEAYVGKASAFVLSCRVHSCYLPDTEQ